MEIRSSEWPQGLNADLAVIDMTVAEAAEYFDVQFKEDFDDLDWFSYAIMDMDGEQFALIRYRGAPIPGVTLIGMSNVAINTQLEHFFRTFDVEDRLITWKADSLN